jgi:glycosyltransferase involved in cell wall biosynthesis
VTAAAPDAAAHRATRVWIVNHYAFAPDRAAGTRHYDFAVRLAALGYRVTIFAASFSHLTGRDERISGAKLTRGEWFGPVRFVWLRTVRYRGNTWRRQLNMLSFLVVFLVVQTRQARPDVVIGSTVHPFAALGAWLVARARGARFVFEIRDLWPQTLVDLGAMRVGSPGERLLRALEAFLVRRASVVVTLLPGMRDYLAERGLPANHVVYIPNGVDLDAFDAAVSDTAPPPEGLARATAEIALLREQGRFVLGYIGSFGRVNRVDVVVEAALLAERRAPGRIGLVLVGDGPARSALVEQAGASPAVTVCDSIPKRFVPGVLRAFDGAVVHATATPVYRYGISFNKLFEYMAAARPVVFACASSYDPVADAGAGLTVAPDDPSVLADAFLELAAVPRGMRDAMGAAGREYVARTHSINRLGDDLASVVDGRVLQERVLQGVLRSTADDRPASGPALVRGLVRRRDRLRR